MGRRSRRMVVGEEEGEGREGEEAEDGVWPGSSC